MAAIRACYKHIVKYEIDNYYDETNVPNDNGIRQHLPPRCIYPRGQCKETKLSRAFPGDASGELQSYTMPEDRSLLSMDPYFPGEGVPRLHDFDHRIQAKRAVRIVLGKEEHPVISRLRKEELMNTSWLSGSPRGLNLDPRECPKWTHLRRSSS